MAIDGNIEYAVTRVHGRYGQRLGKRDWHRLEGSHDLGQYLDAVRTTALAEWVSALDRTRDSHAIERFLRIQWRRHVGAVAAWHPLKWQPWLEWLGWLPALSLLAQLSRPDPAPPWMMADTLLGPISLAVPAERAAALSGTALAVFESAISGRGSIGATWRAHWRSLRPRSEPHTQHLLDAVLHAFDQCVQQLARQSSSTAARQQLSERLARLFRAGAGTVAATVCYLALLAIDLERLRGGLIGRCVFDTLAADAA